MSCRIGNRENETVVRSTAWLKCLGGLLVLATLGVFGSILAQEQPPKSKAASQARQAKRPLAARIQTNLELASKTKVEFRQPPELTYQDFNADFRRGKID
jgi:hypothetical protein